MTSLDNYKLNNPNDDGYYSDCVSSCCGAEVSKYCSDDEHMHEAIMCDDCGCECEQIEQYEYDEKMREHYAEMRADEMRDLR